MSDIRDPERDQVAPIHNDQPSCHDLVIEDMAERKEFGLRKYKTELQPFNGRSFTQDAYEEVLDLAVYLRGKLEEERQTEQEPDGLRSKMIQAIHKHAEDMKHYTLMSKGGFFEGYFHALQMIQRDAAFIAHQVLEGGES